MNKERRKSSMTTQRCPTSGMIGALVIGNTLRSLPGKVFERKLDEQVPPAIDGDDLARDRGRLGQQRHGAADLFQRWADAQRRAAVHLTKLLLGLIAASQHETWSDAVDARLRPQAHGQHARGI